MKRSLFLLFFLFPSFLIAQSNIDVLHYRFNIGLNDISDSIYGIAEIKVKFMRSDTVVGVDLTNLNNNQKGMIVTVAKFVQHNMPEIEFRQTKEKLFIRSLSQYQKGDTANILISYKGIPADGLIISKNKYGHRTFFGDNWPNRAHNWIPCHDDPADKASVEFIITAPNHYQVVANGIQVEEKSTINGFKETHWKEDVSISTKVMTIGVADFSTTIVGNLNDCVPIYSWTYPEDSQKGIYDFAVTKDILQYYSKAIGPYAFKKLANVQSKTRFGGLENANTIFYKEEAITGDRSYESLYAHEIAHQWFGNVATEKSFAHLWLSEGFATFLTIAYFENKYGKDTATKMRKEDREQVIVFAKANHTPVVNETETDYMQLLNENNYQKGGWILHMLRTQLGDSIFWKAMRKYYADYSGDIAGTENLQKVFETVSGKDLKQFFKQWLYTPGIPDLDIKWKYNEKKRVIEVTIRQLQSIPFSFAFEIKYARGNMIALKKVLNVSATNETFSIPLNQKPTVVSFDPGVNLLYNGKVSRVK